MKKVIALLSFFFILTTALKAQEKRYYGICYYQINKILYVSMPMRSNKDWGKGGFMESGYTKFDVIKQGLKKEFQAKLLSRYNVTIEDCITCNGDFNAYTHGDYQGVLKNGCTECFWTYDEAKKVMAQVIDWMTYNDKARAIIVQ